MKDREKPEKFLPPHGMPSDGCEFAFSSRVPPKALTIKIPYTSWNYQIQQGEEVPKEPIIFPGSEAVEDLPRREMEGACQIMLLVLPRREYLLLGPLWHPGCPHLGQQMDIEFIGKDQHLTVLQLFLMKADARQPLDTLGVIIFRHQLGALPDPAEFVEPAPYRLGRHLQAVFSLEGGRERGTTPPCAAPSVGAWRRLEQRPQRALQPGPQDGRADRGRQGPVGLNRQTEGAGSIGLHNAGDTGARAEQKSRNLRRRTAGRTEQ